MHNNKSGAVVGDETLILRLPPTITKWIKEKKKVKMRIQDIEI